MTGHVTDVRPAGYDDILITVRWVPGWFGRLFGRSEKTTAYRGSCTVWDEYPTGRSCGLDVEYFLYRVWLKHKWGGE